MRPTAEAVRDAVMKLVGEELAGADVLDLFAGTGAFGIEALSRGAARCDFVENHASALHALKANVAAFRLRDRTRIFDRDAIPFVERLPANAYAIAFLDPPYGSRKLDRVLARWRNTPFSRLLVVEHDAAHEGLPAGESHHFDETAVTVYRAPPA